MYGSFIGQVGGKKPVVLLLQGKGQAVCLLSQIGKLLLQHSLKIVFHRQMELPFRQRNQQTLQHRLAAEILQKLLQGRIISVLQQKREGSLLHHLGSTVLVRPEITGYTKPHTSTAHYLGTEAVEGRYMGRIKLCHRRRQTFPAASVRLDFCSLDQLPVNPLVHLRRRLSGKGQSQDAVYPGPSPGY